MKAKGHAIGRLIVSTTFLGALAFGVIGCDDRLARMEDNQGRLQAMVAANARQIAMVSSQLYVGNNEVQDGIQKLDRNDQDLGTGISTVQNGQDALHETVTIASKAMDKKMVTLDENQRLLRDGVSQVAGVTQRTASDVTAIAGEQATLHQMVQSGRRELGDSIATVAVNQEKTRTDIGQLQQADQRMADQLVALAASQDRIHSGLDSLSKFMQVVARDVTGISQGQTALQQAINEHTVVFAEKSALLEQNQRNTQTAVDGIAADARKNTGDIAALAAGQTVMQQTLNTNHKIVAGQVAAVIQNQQGLQAGINGLTEKTGQTTSQLTALATGQDTIRETLNNGNGTVAAKLAGLSENQAGLQSNLTGLHQKADTIVGSVATVRTEQASLHETLKANHEAMKDQVTQLSSGQQQLQGGLDVLTATTGQTALDVISMAAGQDALTQNLQSHNAAVGGRIADLAGSQEQTQSGLDAVLATAGQTALDMIDLSQGQARLTQAVQADRQELAARLTEIVQSQQQWAQRLDAAQANVKAVTANIAAIEQHLTGLQGSLQPSLDGLTSQLGANGQGRAQFEAKMNQDIQVIVDAVAQLRQDQASLTDQMQQIQKRTLSQTKDIITAIQQLRQPPADVKISDSGVNESDSGVKVSSWVNVSDSGTKLESSVAEAAAK